MKNLIDTETLADSRLEEAEYLSKGGYLDGAFYLAGYSIELYTLPVFGSMYKRISRLTWR